LNGLDLFTGIGGITLGLSKWVKPICYCEIEPYAQSVLKSRIKDGSLPAAPIWDDIRTLDGLPFRGLVDIIYAGFPCQDLSVAGKGEGLEGKRSGLFFEIMRLAEEIKPSFIFLENVPAITGRGLDTVVKEIASLRYDCRYGVLSAFDVGAPHKRERWFLLAHSMRNGQSTAKVRQGIKKSNDRNKTRKEGGTEFKGRSKALRQPRSNRKSLANPLREGLERWEKPKAAWKAFAEYGCDGASRGISGIPKPAICRNDDGIRNRAHRIKCLGNAVVPAQVQEAFKRLIGLNNGAF